MGWVTTLIVVSVIFALAVILVPTLTTLSVSYVDRNMYAFRKNSITNQVDQEVFTSGRYFWGPTYSPIQFDGEYIRVNFLPNQLLVFSSTGLEFGVGISVYYRLETTTLRQIFNQFGTTYNITFSNVIKAAIKNVAPMFTAEQYVSNRSLITGTFLNSVNQALLNVGISIQPDRFMLVGVSFPSSVSNRYLDNAIQLLSNQVVILQRDVDLINSETNRLVASIEANITLTSSQGAAGASQLIQNAIELGKRQYNEAKGQGIGTLISQLNITTSGAYQELLEVMTLLDMNPSKVVLGGSSQLLINA